MMKEFELVRDFVVVPRKATRRMREHALSAWQGVHPATDVRAAFGAVWEAMIREYEISGDDERDAG